jgi:glycine/D-amino acid oxidase-like deaminating enzyme
VNTAADAVVVGGGTVGGWTAYFLKRSGLQRVVLVEAGTLGQGASSRAAGMVRAQGGTPTADRLGLYGLPESLDRVAGVTVAAAGGHGMMWGPGVSRAAADLALTGGTQVIDVTDLGLDRFDAEGCSRLDPDPIALPFPERT